MNIGPDNVKSSLNDIMSDMDFSEWNNLCVPCYFQSPPKSPQASTTTEWLPSQAFKRMVPSVLLLHFVSCMKKIWGFSYYIMFLIILYFARLFNPRKSHDVSLIIQYWVAVCNTFLTWNIFWLHQHFPNDYGSLHIYLSPSFLGIFGKDLPILLTT